MFILRSFFIILFLSQALLLAQDRSQKPDTDYYNTVLTTVDGKSYDGSILYVADSFVVFWNSSESYSEEKLDTHAIKLTAGNIEHIAVDRDNDPISGMGYGLLAGATTATITNISSRTGSEQSKIFGLVSVLGSTIVGGMIGVFEERDNYFRITGQSANFKVASNELKGLSIFPERPPVEVSAYVNQYNKLVTN